MVVRHRSGPCPIYLAPGLLERLSGLLATHLPGRRVAVIADETVARLYPPPAGTSLFTFPAGEASKTRDTWGRLTDALLTAGFGRDTGLVALGGGVTGDLAGFVAATFLRGVPLVQVPTTLLAMLDASVGGKTAVDTPAGKNLVGAFHPPAAVVMDPLVLRTLSEAEFRNGLAEAVKHAAIDDRAHFCWLASVAGRVLQRSPDVMVELIRRSLGVKAAIVEQDETEQGRRALLNAGHTVAHALEAAAGYRLAHGEAVAVGLALEAALGERLGMTEAGTAQSIRNLLRQFGLPAEVPNPLQPDDVIAAMRADKKNRAGQIRLSLLAGLGQPAGDDQRGWTTAVGEADLRSVLGA